MGILNLEPIDLYGTSAEVVTGGWSRVATTYAVLQTGEGRFGGNSLYARWNQDRWTKPFVMTGTTCVVAAAFRVEGLANSPVDFFQLLNNGGADTCLRLTTTTAGSIVIKDADNSTVATSSPGVVDVDQYYWLEVKVTSIGTSATVTVRINENELFGGALTTFKASQASTLYESLVLASNQSNISYGVDWDDIMIIDGSAGLSDFPGDTTMFVGTATADGTSPSTDWSIGGSSPAASLWQSVDETVPGGSDGGVTLIETDVIGRETQLAMANMPSAPGVIHAVQTVLQHLKDDGGTRTIQEYVDSGGTAYTGNTYSPLTTETYGRTIREVDPNTSSAWLEADVNALELGAKLLT